MCKTLLRSVLAAVLVFLPNGYPVNAEELDPPEVGIKYEKEILEELKRLNIEIAGKPKQFEETLPLDLMAGARWGVVTPSCRAAGYHLDAHTGESVLVTSFPIKEPMDARSSLIVVVVSKEKKIVCAYKVDRELIPGVYPANTTSRDLDERIAADTAEEGKAFEADLKINGEASLDNNKIKIKFLGIVEDTRCPVGLDCYWSGYAKAEITVSIGKTDYGHHFIANINNESYNLTNKVYVSDYEIELRFDAVSPPRRFGAAEIDPKDYAVHLIVRPEER